jgi:hypothetical protein
MAPVVIFSTFVQMLQKVLVDTSPLIKINFNLKLLKFNIGYTNQSAIPDYIKKFE